MKNKFKKKRNFRKKRNSNQLKFAQPKISTLNFLKRMKYIKILKFFSFNRKDEIQQKNNKKMAEKGNKLRNNEVN